MAYKVIKRKINETDINALKEVYKNLITALQNPALDQKQYLAYRKMANTLKDKYLAKKI